MGDPVPTQDFDINAVVLHEGLTPMQNAYVYFRGLGYTPIQAARRAGYQEPKGSAKENERNPAISPLIAKGLEETRVRYNLDRDHVVEGMLEALAVAREQSDAKTMLNVWVEMAKVTGLGAPEVKEVKVTGEVTQHHISHASDSELLAIVGRQRELDRLTVEAEYEVVDE